MGRDWFDKITSIVGVTLLGIILIVGILQIVNRYVSLPLDLYWTYEVARTLLAVMTLAGLPFLFKNNSDISFLPVLQRITDRTDAFLLIRNVILLIFTPVMVWSSYLAYDTTGDVGLPMIGWIKVGWGFIFLGICFGLLFLFVVLDTRERMLEIRGAHDV